VHRCGRTARIGKVGAFQCQPDLLLAVLLGCITWLSCWALFTDFFKEGNALLFLLPHEEAYIEFLRIRKVGGLLASSLWSTQS
jgi:superfamily II DNA/RNA helicase